MTRNFGQNEEKQTKKEYDAALDELIEKEGTEVKDTIDELCAKRKEVEIINKLTQRLCYVKKYTTYIT